MARGLGKGLEGLFEDNLTFDGSSSENGLRTVRISLIEPNKAQPRKAFDKEKIDELSLSIKENGVLQPLIVRELNNGRYQIISGERRWRASRQAGLEEIPVIVKELSDQQVLEIGLIENLQREDLNAVEEARGYRTLMSEFGLTQEQVAEKVSKSRPAVANALRILALPDEVLDLVLSGDLTSGHARALLPLADMTGKAEMIRLAKEIAEKGLSVRAVEAMAKTGPVKPTGKKDDKSTLACREITDALTRKWGRKVTVTQEKKNGKIVGAVSFEYYGTDDLNNLIEQLTDKEV